VGFALSGSLLEFGVSSGTARYIEVVFCRLWLAAGAWVLEAFGSLGLPGFSKPLARLVRTVFSS
jgi:hypothetical protein